MADKLQNIHELKRIVAEDCLDQDFLSRIRDEEVILYEG
jgi:hypothetical protein